MMETTRRYDGRTLLWLTVGTILLPVLGWAIGVGRLWNSERWTRFDKMLGTAFYPLIVFGPFVVFATERADSVCGARCNDALTPLDLTMIIGLIVLVGAVFARLGYRLASVKS